MLRKVIHIVVAQRKIRCCKTNNNFVCFQLEIMNLKLSTFFAFG